MICEIRALSVNDDRRAFSSGNEELDLFFHKYAEQNQFKHYIGSTYVLLFDQTITGFFTVSAGSIKTDLLPERMSKKLPEYPLPILRISRLAVDKRYQGKGMGKTLLKFILNLAVEQKNRYGCVGLVVDAKEESISFYEQFDFERIHILHGHLDTRPYTQTLFLSMQTILKAMAQQEPFGQ